MDHKALCVKSTKKRGMKKKKRKKSRREVIKRERERNGESIYICKYTYM